MIGSTRCFPCAANTYNENSQSASADSCKPCPDSAPVSPAGSGDLLQCIAALCADGLYTDTTMANSPACALTCPPGSRCRLGVQTICPAGSFQSMAGQAQCQSCGAGYFSAQGSSSRSECHPCPKATYSSLAVSPACSLCLAGYTTTTVGSQLNSQCVPFSTPCAAAHTLSGSSVALCPLGCSEPILLTSIGAVALQLMNAFFAQVDSYSSGITPANLIVLPRSMRQLSSVDTSSQSSVSSTSLKTQFVATSLAPSLRVSAFGLPDALLTAAVGGATNAGMDGMTETAPDAGKLPELSTENAISTTILLALLIVLSVLAFITLATYRLLPAKVALRLDRYKMDTDLAVGESPKLQPSQFGAACTLAFVCMAVLVGVYLGGEPNTLQTTALMSPSGTTPGVLAGSAKALIQITLLVHSGAASLPEYCSTTSASNWLSSSSTLVQLQSGFSRSFSLRTAPSPTSDGSAPSACAIAVDCVDCRITSTNGVLEFELPYTAQLIEWEVFSSGAALHETWSRRYGVLTQLPGELLDAHGRLTLSAIESFYIDKRSSSNAATSGYEVDFKGYETVTAQASDAFNSNSSVRVEFALEGQSIVLQTRVSTLRSPLQLAASILSVIVSLFSVFAIIFSQFKTKVLPMASLHTGPVCVHKDTGEAFVHADGTTASGKKPALRNSKAKPSSEKSKVHSFGEVETLDVTNTSSPGTSGPASVSGVASPSDVGVHMRRRSLPSHTHALDAAALVSPSHLGQSPVPSAPAEASAAEREPADSGRTDGAHTNRELAHAQHTVALHINQPESIE
jgi:hypothetical protein